MKYDDKQLTYEELQVAVMLLLGKTRLSAADKNALRFATQDFRKGEVDLRKRLERLLRDTELDREEKRETPRKQD